ncbi:group-specific protein [Bacillus sp. HNG]|uniref:group-specific protein n=1 Tax=Bacillus sp. HNG TaxID=2293325 RepID=UPI000E2EB3FC|nr:group-specific protein [Bacillus sp. HNG]RFB19266.1 group-specific protein [Bacillus sp. HNG]
MSTCNIDHTLEDVVKKLQSQETFLPKELYHNAIQFLETERTQLTLNEFFHLLKKYDLASEEEQQKRNLAMEELFQA